MNCKICTKVVMMGWLDSVYPPGSTSPGSKRGPCDPNVKRDVWTLRRTVPNSQYTLSNLQVRSITNYGPTPSPSPSPSPVPSPVPSPSPSPVPSPVPTPQCKQIKCSECVIEC